jgi:RNA polymerase sigma-70 factor (ECF subfamily)
MAGPPDPDAVLIGRVARGDDGAFSTLYRRHAPVVRLIAYRGLGDAGAADDVVQEVFVDAWRHAAAFDPARASFATWLRTIAARRVIDARRRAAARPRLAVPTAASEPRVPDATGAVLDRLVVDGAFDVLSDDQRRLLRLAFWGGLTYAEIGERTATPLGTIKSRARSGMARLAGAIATA